jgi:ammonium transporter Rh
MIFIGFGFLMTFIKTMSWTALSYNWIVSCWAFQISILTLGFWHKVIDKEAGLKSKIDVSLESMIVGDFGAGAAMITFGAILGKANL